MSDPRRAAEMAVIEAARVWLAATAISECAATFQRLEAAMHALDSLPPSPPPDKPWAVYFNRNTGRYDVCPAHLVTADRAMAIVSLPATSSPPPGETERVRVAVYRWPSGAIDAETIIGDDQPRDGPLVAIITAHIPTKPPAIPEVAGSVEAPE